MTVYLSSIPGPRTTLTFSSTHTDATCRKKIDTLVDVPTQRDTTLTSATFHDKAALQVGTSGYLARRNAQGQWQLVDKLEAPVSAADLATHFGLFNPGALGRWKNTNLDALPDKRITPLANRTMVGIIDGDAEGSWFRGFNISVEPSGISVNTCASRPVAVLNESLRYLNTWTESN